MISLVGNDVACFTFEAIVCHVVVDVPRDLSPGGYTSPPVREALSLRKDISYPSVSISWVYLPSREASSSSAASWVRPEVIEGSLDGDILRPGGDSVFACA